MTAPGALSELGQRQDGGYTPPFLAEPTGGPVPEWTGGGDDDDVPLTAAGKARRIRGLDDERLTAWEDQAETAMAAALAEVMDTVAGQIARAAAVASGRVLWTGCSYCLSPRHAGRCQDVS